MQPVPDAAGSGSSSLFDLLALPGKIQEESALFFSCLLLIMNAC